MSEDVIMPEEISQNDFATQSEPIPDFMVQQLRVENAEDIVNLKWFRVYWGLFLILCIVLIESFFKSGVALGTVLWFAMTEVIAIFFAKYCTGKLNKKALLLCVPIALINIGQLLFFSMSTQIITWPVALALFALQLTYLSKPKKDSLFDFKNILDVLYTVFVNAFVFIAYPFKGLLRFTNEGSKRIVIHVLIGIVISLPIAGIFAILFAIADRSFATFVGDIVKYVNSNLGVVIKDLIIGTIMCIFVSAALVGANARELISRSSLKDSKEVNNVTLGTVLAMVSVVVALYVGIQFNHWFGNVPVNYIQMDEYSNLARSGFFELVWASCFLLALIIAVAMVSSKRNGQLIPFIKAPLILLCACNFIVLYSAVEKMAVYIVRSGITSKRILVLWLVAAIVVCLAGVIIKIMRFSFKAFNFSCVAVVALVCVLSFVNMDYYVAKNHIYLAEHHLIQNIERDMLCNLSYAAAEPIAEFKDRLEHGQSAFDSTKMQSQAEALSILNDELQRHERAVNYSTKENPLMGFNFSRLNAGKALKDI